MRDVMRSTTWNSILQSVNGKHTKRDIILWNWSLLWLDGYCIQKQHSVQGSKATKRVYHKIYSSFWTLHFTQIKSFTQPLKGTHTLWTHRSVILAILETCTLFYCIHFLNYEQCCDNWLADFLPVLGRVFVASVKRQNGFQGDFLRRRSFLSCVSRHL